MSIFSVGLLMSQIDFLLIRLAADLMVNTFTTFKFLRGKEVNFRMYEAEGNHQPSQNPSSLHDAAQALTDVLGESDDSTQPLNGYTRP
jgi:hypothetical protein